jgi:hypothetical protein
MVFIELYIGVPWDAVRFADLDRMVGQVDQQNCRLAIQDALKKIQFSNNDCIANFFRSQLTVHRKTQVSSGHSQPAHENRIS